MRGAPLGLRPYKVRTPLEKRCCMERSMCRFAFVIKYLLIYNIISNASYIPKECEAALFKKSAPPQNDKNFPQEHPPYTKRNNSSFCKGGCSWGKFSEGRGGLEGEGRLFQEASLPLQGLSSFLPTTYSKCNESAVRKACAPRRESVGISRFAPQPRQVTRIPSGVISAS